MLRRTSKSRTTLDQSKQNLAQQELELRNQMEKLERMIAEAPRLAEEMNRLQREELLRRASGEGSRLDVSLELRDKRYGDEGRFATRRRSMRKERRDGRIIFIVLVIALLLAVIWLVAHLRSF